MALFDDLMCSDEDIAKDTVADYIQIAPQSGMVAFGKDGQIVTASAPWDVVSANGTVNFATRQVESGHVINIQETTGAKYSDLLAVDSVSGTTCTTRRIGKSTGFGQPPGPNFSAYTGLWFTIVSCESLIRNWTNWIRERLRITSTPVADLKAGDRAETFEQACANLVLYQLYRDKAKEGGSSLGGAAKVAGSEYAWKAKDHWDLVMAPAGGLLAVLFETYGPSPQAYRKARTGQLKKPKPYPPDPYGPPRVYVDTEWGDASGLPDWTGFGG